MGKKKGGKTPQGRAKLKDKANRSGGSPWAKQVQSDWSDDDAITGFRGFGGSTTRSFSAKDPNVKLRHKTIAFISASTNTPIDTEEEVIDEELIAAIELNDRSSGEEEAAIPQVDGPMDVDMTAADVMVDESVEEQVSFVIDTVGSDVLPPRTSTAAIDKILQRAATPESDSDDEIILFRGRNKIVNLDDPYEPRPTKQEVPQPSKTPAVAVGPIFLENNSLDSRFTPVPEGGFWRNGGPSNVSKLQEQVDLSGAPAEETVEMLQAAWKQAKKEKEQRKSRAEDTGASRRGKRGRKKSNRQLRDMDDSDIEAAAYEDYLDNIAAQDKEAEIDDDIPDVVDAIIGSDDDWEDTADTEDEVIGQDLSELDDSESDELDSSDLEDELLQTERELYLAEDLLHGRRQQAKSDEAIARLWQKQLELGITNDELIIDDGDDDYEGVGDVAAARAGFEDFIGLSSKRQKKTKKRLGRDPVFPDASALADTLDQYGNDGFDIMDYDRPSLRATKKGRKGKLPPELEGLSDEELRQNVRDAWDNDREKKRVKKAEREEQRALGLLGSKNGRPHLPAKYQQGLTGVQVHAELQIFLDDEDRTTLAFPPMDKFDRKQLHTLANLLNLKSKSIGSGANRAPVLTKTRNTRAYSEMEFKRITSFSRGWFLENNSRSGKAKKSAMPGKRGGGASMAAASLRHGEVVGAGAKEIGKDSIGHRLMEKMGWAKGQALGKDGEGVLQPVEQMMRVGRAGLG